MRSPKKDTTTVLPSISSPSQGLSNLSSIEPIPVPVEEVDISGNPIKDFFGLKTFSSIEILECSNTQLTSFNYFPEQNGVKVFNCKKTPLSGYQSLNVMCVIVFGDSLVSVNGVNINAKTKKIGLKLVNQLRPLLVTGWIIQNFDPIRIVDTNTRKRKTIFVSNNSSKSIRKQEKEDLSGENVYLNGNVEDEEDENDKNINNDINHDETEEKKNERENENEEKKGIDIKEINEEKEKEETDKVGKDENDEYLRERFNRLQERILNEIKKPDIIPPILKNGRISSLSATQQSRPTSSLHITLKNSNDKTASPLKKEIPQ